MFFGPLPPHQAVGGVLAHRVRAGETVLAKGHRLSEADAEQLRAAAVTEVTVALLEPGDVPEDEAAHAVATRAAGADVRVAPAFTGRANLFAEADGVLLLGAEEIGRFNRIDEGLTIATLPAFRRVVAGEMIGTVKVIPFAISGAVFDAGMAALAARKAIAVAAFRPKRIGIIQLTSPTLKAGVLDKTLRVTLARAQSLGATIVFEERIPHDQDRLRQRLANMDRAAFDILLIFGAAAITDRRDVIPAAISAAGGRIIHLGMPVDPGNLLLLAEFGSNPVIGAPGCARAPAENGFDWVLERLAADIPVTQADIQAMGVGGLLMEIISRPQPRAGAQASAKENEP